MPDNAQSGSTFVAADELFTLNGVEQSVPLPKAQRVKVIFGGDSQGTDVSEQSPLPVADAAAHGAFGYAAGAAPATVDVPATGRIRRVSVIAGAAAATITIAGGALITVPAGERFDEPIVGDAPLGSDVVIAGAVASFYVAWVT